MNPFNPMELFRVRKVLPDGSVKIEYKGTLRNRSSEHISIDTGWSREPLDLDYVLLETEDRWIETFYLDRWYNIFRIASGEGDLKGFYLNISKPPVIEGNLISWEDLAIDIWVRPDGTYIILDMDEFEELEIDDGTRKRALEGLENAKEFVERKEGPLSELRA